MTLLEKFQSAFIHEHSDNNEAMNKFYKDICGMRDEITSALTAQQKTAEPCGDLVAKVEHLHNLFCYGIDHATQAQERQTIIDRLMDLCEKSHPFKREIIAALKQPAAPTQIDAVELEKAIQYVEGWADSTSKKASPFEAEDLAAFFDVSDAARAHLSKLSGGV